jgi:hypothetical protein
MAKTDSASGAVSAFQSAMTDIEPPAQVTLREQDWPFWYAITRARAKESWTDIDLVHAASLARTQADIEQVQSELNEEGFTLVNDRGTVVANPKNSILETLSRRSIALSRSLQVHAHATQGDSHEQVRKNKTQKKAQDAIKDAGDDGLIPRRAH